MTFDWDPFKPGSSGGFVKFDAIGDEIVGRIVAIRTHTFKEDKGPVPLIDLEPIDGGEGSTLAVDKIDLRAKVAELEPQVGDLLAVKFVSKEQTPNGTKKVFAVRHKVGERPAGPDPFGGEPEYPPGEEPC